MTNSRYYLIMGRQLLMIGLLLTTLAGADPATVEQEIVDRCNQIRAAHGLPTLKTHPRLLEAARQHSSEMLELGYFGHTSPSRDYRRLRDRLLMSRHFDLTFGENIYKCRGYDEPDLARKAVDAWMASPAHRKNLLNPRFNRIGVGVVGEGDTFLFTQVFSYQTVEILDQVFTPQGSGIRLDLRGRVHEGPRTGALLVGGQKVAEWKSDATGHFAVSIRLEGLAPVAVGQTTSPYQWRIETEVRPRL